MVPCSHAHVLKRSTPAIADDALLFADTTFFLLMALVPCGPVDVLRFYFTELARPQQDVSPVVDRWALFFSTLAPCNSTDIGVYR